MLRRAIGLSRRAQRELEAQLAHRDLQRLAGAAAGMPAGFAVSQAWGWE